VERTVAYNTGGVADCARTKILNNVLGRVDEFDQAKAGGEADD
jgi:hypothetical protein